MTSIAERLKLWRQIKSDPKNLKVTILESNFEKQKPMKLLHEKLDKNNQRCRNGIERKRKSGKTAHVTN